jgi:hypothetical protein
VVVQACQGVWAAGGTGFPGSHLWERVQISRDVICGSNFRVQAKCKIERLIDNQPIGTDRHSATVPFDVREIYQRASLARPLYSQHVRVRRLAETSIARIKLGLSPLTNIAERPWGAFANFCRVMAA